MYIYRHHTAGDVIDLDDKTGLWSAFPEDRTRIPTGLMTLTQRALDPIRGSYTIENDKRCSCYWSECGEFVFRTPDNQRFCLFRREVGGKIVDLFPELSVALLPSEYNDGRAIPGMSTFSLVDVAGNKLFELSYNSEKYIRYYLGNFTFVPDENLSDWDFFVAVKSTVEELKIIARAWIEIVSESSENVPAGEIVIVKTGTPCPRAGLWIPCRHLEVLAELSIGQTVPDVEGRSEDWVWVGVGLDG